MNFSAETRDISTFDPRHVLWLGEQRSSAFILLNCAREEVQTGSAAIRRTQRGGAGMATGDLTARRGAGDLSEGRWRATGQATSGEGPAQAIAVELHERTGRGKPSKATFPMDARCSLAEPLMSLHSLGHTRSNARRP